jgi:uncharacterized membrane protein
LSSDAVWDKTHRVGGKLFKGLGIVFILSIFLGSWSFYIILGSVLLVTAYLFYYSYAEYQKETKK